MTILPAPMQGKQVENESNRGDIFCCFFGTGVIPLTIHPIPFKGERLSLWLNRVAEENLLDFDFIITVLSKLRSRYSLQESLELLARIDYEHYACLILDLKEDLIQHERDFPCLIVNCESNFTTRVNRRRHYAIIHDIGETWHYCDTCQYKTKSLSHLKTHKANITLMSHGSHATIASIKQKPASI